MFYGGIIASLLVIVALIFVWIKWDILQILKDITGMYGRKTNVSHGKHTKSQTSGKLRTVTSEIQLRPNEKDPPINQNIGETETLQESNKETTMLQDEGLDETTILTEANETTLLQDDQMIRQNTWVEPEKTIVVVHATAIESKESETSEQVESVRN